MVSAIITLLSALFRAVPSLANLVSEAYALAERANEAEAAKRKQAKDAAVESAIYGSQDKDANAKNAQ